MSQTLKAICGFAVIFTVICLIGMSDTNPKNCVVAFPGPEGVQNGEGHRKCISVVGCQNGRMQAAGPDLAGRKGRKPEERIDDQSSR